MGGVISRNPNIYAISGRNFPVETPAPPSFAADDDSAMEIAK